MLPGLSPTFEDENNPFDPDNVKMPDAV